MEKRFTQGEWTVEQGGLIYSDSEYTTIATVCSIRNKDCRRIEQYSNAKLISAVPDLLSALQNLMNSIG